jgi:hypothetical protein
MCEKFVGVIFYFHYQNRQLVWGLGMRKSVIEVSFSPRATVEAG